MDVYKIRKTRLILIFLFLPFFKPRGVIDMAKYVGGIWTGINTIYLVLKVFSLLILLIGLILHYRKMNWYFVPVLLYQLFLIGNDYIRGISAKESIISLLIWMLFIFTMDMLIKDGKSEDFFGSIAFILFMLVLINFISLIVCPNGMYTDERGWIYNWFLGYKNGHIYIQLPYIAFSAMYFIKKENCLPLIFWLSQLIVLASAIICGSSTGAGVILLVLVLLFAYNIKKVTTRINIIVVFLGFSILSLLFIKYNFQNNFSELIYFLFRKEATFTSRTDIWKMSSTVFWDNKFFGVGNSVYYLEAVKMVVTQSHNRYLDILYTGGMIGYLLYTLMIISSGYKAYKNKRCFIITILTIVCTAYFLLFVFEAKRDFDLFYIILILFMYGDYYTDENVNPNKKRKIRFILK